MGDQFMGAAAIGILLVLISLPTLFSALKESGRIKPPKFGKKSNTSFRQFPTFPEDGTE